ncbi:hypothetical protein [Endozoicomonas sp. ONNA2]|uniref:hypothetical protein n=1 Tax=Endozoicomonas sp. ONNA2 TaxID=2828741 RepID=UPI0021477567|nr:hypothetical protein [Endozoicomonas sp. ONNA2]
MAKFQEPEYPCPLSLDGSISVSSTNEVEPVNAHLMSLESDLFTTQYFADSLQQRLNHCHLLENYANSLTKESSEWTKAWQDALNFALNFSKVDYHFNLNVANALISLNNIDKAKLLLFDQLTRFDDQNFLYCVRKLLGFVFFKERKYVDSVKLYMRVFFSTNNVPDENYSHICTSMQYMLKECNDQPFVIEAINWFNGLKPKSGKMTIDPSGFILPSTGSSTSCSETTENTKKFLTSDQATNAIFGWRKLAALAKTKKPGDPSWNSIWENALGLAFEYAKVDYHFNVNVAIALTRLNLLDQATDILLQQLRRPELASDPQFRRAVNKQLAFVYFRKRDYPGCIYHYMSCYWGANSKVVSDNSFQYITTAIQVCCTKKDLQPEFLRSALRWYHQLLPQSLADQCLLETKQEPSIADGFSIDEVGWQ